MNPETLQPATARSRFLQQHLHLAEGERAPRGFADRYAAVYQGSQRLGLVAVDAGCGVWYAAAAPGGSALETTLKAHGFRHAGTNALAALFSRLLAKPRAAFIPRMQPAELVAPSVPMAKPMPFRARREAPAPVEADLISSAA
jgi:hypothetical protein